MSDQPKSPPTQLVRRIPQGLVPTTWDGWKEQATFAANSGIVPKELAGNPAACLVAMQFGASLGLEPLQALQSVMVVNGRPAIFGDALLALCQAHPEWDRRAFSEWAEGQGEAYTALCRVGRHGYGEPVVGRFSVAEAIRASLWGKSGPWTFYPGRMLQMRARAFALRNLYADVLRGIQVAEEVQDVPTEAPPPKPVASYLPATPATPGAPPARPPSRADAIAQTIAAQVQPMTPTPPVVPEVPSPPTSQDVASDAPSAEVSS